MKAIGCDVLILGGGMVGLAIAHQLVQEGDIQYNHRR